MSNEVAVTDPPEQAESDQPRGDDEPSDPDAGPDEAEDVEEQLSLDVIFEVLKNQRRRLVLKYLKSTEDTVSLGELAEHVAAQENGKSVDAITSDERKRVYVGLYQCHLPKMDDMDIVEFNRNRGLVELTDTAAQLDEYLEREEPTAARRWYRYYGLLAALGIVLAAFASAGVEPVASTSTLLFAAVTLAFAACAGVHALSVSDDEQDG